MTDALDLVLGLDKPQSATAPQETADAMDLIMQVQQPNAVSVPAGPGGRTGAVASGVTSQADPDLFERVIGAARDVYDYMEGGNRREFDLPELGTSGDKVSPFSKAGLRMAGAYATSLDPEGVADVAMKVLPGAERKADKFGNPIITFDGKDYYVNRPGVSEADMFQILAQIGAYSPAARVGRGSATSLRAAKTAAASGATSIGLDVAAGELGSEQGVNMENAAVAAAGGGAFELASPFVARGWRAIFGNPSLVDDAGRLTDRGRRTAQAAGLDPDDLPPDAAKYFSDAAVDATDPRHAANMAEANEFGVRMSRGQVTGDYRQLAREEATRHDAYGNRAGDVMRQFDEGQAQDITAARQRIQGSLSGAPEPTVAREAEAGATVLEGLDDRAAALRASIDDAYTAVRETDARLDVDSLTDLARGIRGAVRDFGIDPALHPSALRALQNIAKLSRDVKRAGAGRINAVSLRRIETERRKLGTLIDAAPNKADRTAVVRIKQQLDGWLDDAVDNALFSGDSDALELLKQARGLRREYGQLFEARGRGDAAGKIVSKLVTEDATPEQAINYVFGRGELGSRDTAVQALGRLKDVFGTDGPEWNALREAAWLRLTKEATGQAKTPKKLESTLSRAFERNRSLLETLYTGDELSKMQRFVKTVSRTVTPDDVRNPSKTAFTIARLTRDLMRRTGTMFTFSGNPGAGAALFTLARTPNIMGAAGARRAARGLRSSPQVPAGVVAGGIAGGMALNEVESP